MIPTPQAWAAASWYARQRWARQHALTLPQAQRVVHQPCPPGAATRDRAPVVLFDLPRSLAGDRDPVVLALRRAAATGREPSHPDVLAGLPTWRAAS